MYENTQFVILLLIVLVLYMLPALIAHARDIPQRQTITVVNIVLGWTLIGWLIVFLWAMMAATQADEPA